MLITFFFMLREGGIKVSLTEFLTLLEVLDQRIVGYSVDEFYYLSRACLVKDEALYDIASQAPQTVEDLGSLRTLHNGFARSMRGRAVLEAVGRGLGRDPKTIPPIERGEPMPPEAQAVVDLLRVLLKATAGRHGVAPKLIATSDELEHIARSDDDDLHVRTRDDSDG